MRAEEQAQQAEAQITMFELLRSLLSASHNPKTNSMFFDFQTNNRKVTDPSDAAHNCHHDAALSAGFLSEFSFPDYFQIILIS